jgi:hypothetical protein
VLRLLLYARGLQTPLRGASAPSFRFALGALARADNAERIAVYEPRGWIYRNRVFKRLAVSEVVQVYFEDDDRESPTYGPFSSFETVDGVAYADGAMFARLDDLAGSWMHEATRIIWPSMVVAAINYQ